MGKKIEDHISKKMIMELLEHYESLEAEDKPPDAMDGNSAPKAYDGITSMKLNKILLDQAISELPFVERCCVQARWVRPVTRRKRLEMCRRIGISEAMYFTRTKHAVKMIYDRVNGKSANYKALLDKIDGRA